MKRSGYDGIADADRTAHLDGTRVVQGVFPASSWSDTLSHYLRGDLHYDILTTGMDVFYFVTRISQGQKWTLAVSASSRSR